MKLPEKNRRIIDDAARVLADADAHLTRALLYRDYALAGELDVAFAMKAQIEAESPALAAPDVATLARLYPHQLHRFGAFFAMAHAAREAA